jgi:hypothetical protein
VAGKNDLDAEAFAQLVQLMGDIKRIGTAALLELRAIRMALTDTETDNPTAKDTAKKAENTTLEAVASGDVLERVMKKKIAKQMGVDNLDNLDEAALEMLLDGKLGPPGVDQPK